MMWALDKRKKIIRKIERKQSSKVKFSNIGRERRKRNSIPIYRVMKEMDTIDRYSCLYRMLEEPEVAY